MFTQLCRVELNSKTQIRIHHLIFFPCAWMAADSYSLGISNPERNPSQNTCTRTVFMQITELHLALDALIHSKSWDQNGTAAFLEIWTKFSMCAGTQGCCQSPQLCTKPNWMLFRNAPSQLHSETWQWCGSILFPLTSKIIRSSLVTECYFKSVCLKWSNEFFKGAHHEMGWALEVLKVKPRTA